MKRVSLSVAAAVLILSLTACGGGGGQQSQQPATQTPGSTTPPATAPSGDYDVAKAETLYKNTCVACHGQSLEGSVGPNLQKVGSRLSKDQIELVLKNGRNAMPAGLIKGEDAETVAKWLADKK